MSDQGERLRLLRRKRREERQYSKPIFKLFPDRPCHGPAFDKFWYHLPLWKKIKYKAMSWWWQATN